MSSRCNLNRFGHAKLGVTCISVHEAWQFPLHNGSEQYLLHKSIILENIELKPFYESFAVIKEKFARETTMKIQGFSYVERI